MPKLSELVRGAEYKARPNAGQVPLAGLLDDINAARLRQAQGAMSHRKFDPVTGRQIADAMQSAGLLASPVPVVGDVAGLLGDAAMYATKPEERTWGNAAMTALGALPFVPSVAALKAAKLPRGGLENGKIGDVLNAERASKSSSLLDPKPLPQRPFSDDYPSASSSDAGSTLKQDIEGRELRAPFIAGRNISGDADEGVELASASEIASKLGAPPQGVARSAPLLKGDAGAYVRLGDDRSIAFDKSLPLDAQRRVISHEVGHAIDDLVFGVQGKKGAKIPVDGLSKELASVYENLNTKGWFKPGRGATPKALGYSESVSDAEKMAEAIRAYMFDPNWLKSVAPKTAARIREHANDNPSINRVIQFNSAAPAAVGAGLIGAAAMTGGGEERQ